MNQPPPYSEEMEKSLLGCVLMDGPDTLDICLQHGITEKHFYVPNHKVIWQAIVACDPRYLSQVSVADKLKTAGRLEQAGGAIFLESLIDSVTTTAHAEYFAEELFKYHLRRGLIQFCRTSEELCYEIEDPQELVAKAESFLIASTEAKRTKSKAQVIDELYASVKAKVDTQPQKRAPSSFTEINSTLIQYNGITIIAGRPSNGKSCLMLNDVDHQAEQGFRPLVFSLEMPEEVCLQRMACARSSVTYPAVIRRSLSEFDMKRYVKALAELRKMEFFIEDKRLTIQEIRSRARRYKLKHDIGSVWVDYLQIVKRGKTQRYQDRNNEVAEFCCEIGEMQKELDVPVTIICQLKRLFQIVKKKEGISVEVRPSMQDLRDSGAIEQDGDNILLLSKSLTSPTMSLCDIAKQRNGPPAEFFLEREFKYMRFKNVEQTQEQEEIGYDADSRSDM